jgi:hypothetical protein
MTTEFRLGSASIDRIGQSSPLPGFDAKKEKGTFAFPTTPVIIGYVDKPPFLSILDGAGAATSDGGERRQATNPFHPSMQRPPSMAFHAATTHQRVPSSRFEFGHLRLLQMFATDPHRVCVGGP